MGIPVALRITYILLEFPMSLFDSKIDFVLVETSHPGNIGASARAMKTMGFSELKLVTPKDYPSAEATARAAGADDILAGANVTDSIDSAISESTLIFGTTARDRSEKWPIKSPRDAAKIAADEVAAGGRVSILFGRERSGLNNQELASCHQLIRIPVNPEYSSLNLASAVQVLAYELRMLAHSEPPSENKKQSELASMGDQNALLDQLDKVMQHTGYLELDHPGLVSFHLRRFLLRATPSSKEIKMLHGIIRSIRKHL